MNKPVSFGNTYEDIAILLNGGVLRPYACEYPQELASKEFVDNMDCKNLGYHELDWLILEGKLACEYAWDNYNELVARECVYRLYGPYCSRMGAGIPGSLVSKKKRELKKQTKRKNYHIYELDGNYKLIRVISIRDYTKIELTYHCFEHNGTQYGIRFSEDRKEPFRFEVDIVRYRNGLPAYYGIASCEHLIAHFYEKNTNEKMSVLCYAYCRYMKRTVHGYPVDWDSPIGGLTSPVEKGAWEEDVLYTDFSQYFK